MSANLRGILLMCAAMAAFACEDALIKLASVSVPIGQILALIGVGGTAAFAFFATLQGHRIFTPLALDRALVWRNASRNGWHPGHRDGAFADPDLDGLCDPSGSAARRHRRSGAVSGRTRRAGGAGARCLPVLRAC